MTKLSIITINCNNRGGLQQTMQSIYAQTLPDLEHIIIDGGSTDGSVDLISQYADKIKFWTSEKDNGVYHAMNKGIANSTGDYLLFLNSGDCLIDNDILHKCCQHNFVEDIIYGDLVMEENGKFAYRKEYPEVLSFNFFFQRDSLPHPATFIKRSLFDRVGYYNESLKIISDWEFWLKALFLHAAKYKKLPFLISKFSLGGLSSEPAKKNIFNAEVDDVLERLFPHFIEDYRSYNAISEEHKVLKAAVESSRLIKMFRLLGLTKL